MCVQAQTLLSESVAQACDPLEACLKPAIEADFDSGDWGHFVVGRFSLLPMASDFNMLGKALLISGEPVWWQERESVEEAYIPLDLRCMQPPQTQQPQEQHRAIKPRKAICTALS